MNSLFRKLGLPPYCLDQILALLDEASSLLSNPKDTSTHFHDTAVQLVQSIEALASLVQWSQKNIWPQCVLKPGPAAVENLGPYVYYADIPPNERDILDSIELKALNLKDWLFNELQQAPKASCSGPGLFPAKLCQYCNWPFQQLERGLNESAYLSELPKHIPYNEVCYLLTMDYWPSLSVLKERSLQGCKLCLFLREQLLALVVHQPENSGPHRVSVWIEFLWFPSLKYVKVHLIGPQGFDESLVFTVHTTTDKIADELGIFRPPATASLNPSNLDFIKRQLALTENSTAPNCYRPKRLLDIGLGNQSEPKLIDGREAGLDLGVLRYATLSYCWGSVEQSRSQLKLTADTKTTFYGSISLKAMTPVMRDAITVCRVLGLRFLWIDSLCIQQDGDSTDWEEQSQEMSHIFGNSWLTICAPASGSCLEGFLDHIDRHSPTVNVEYASRENAQVRGTILLRLLTLNGKPEFRHGDSFARVGPLLGDLEYSKWNTRGWVFQERILSPRLLYFGSRMIHFQHGDYVASEDGSSIDGSFFVSRMYGGLFLSTNLVQQLEMIQKKGRFITDFWYKLIFLVSSSKFTDQRDLFPAIAGVARRVHEFTKHRYLAGLWEEDLCCGLLWMALPTPDERGSRSFPANLRQTLRAIKKAQDSIAPSWSWGSRSRSKFLITADINLTCRVRLHLRAEFKVLESRVLVDGVNPYGRISSASISLFGSTIRLSAGSVASMREVDDRSELLCEPCPGLYVFVRTDWMPINERATGIKRQMRAHFQLLLVASCCSDCGDSGIARTVHSQPHENNHADPGRGRAARCPQATEWSISGLTLEQVDAMYLEGMKSEYRNSFYEDSHAGFDVAVHCDLCSDQKLRRDIWGLLIFPAGPTDTYYRVGTFYSRAQHGGSAIFEGTESRKIELV